MHEPGTTDDRAHDIVELGDTEIDNLLNSGHTENAECV